MARGRSLRGSSNSRPSRHGTGHISISKLLMAVFALTTSSCSALIADPKPTHTGLSVQREITLDDPLINVYLRVRSAEPTDHSTTATNSRFSTSETATPVSTPTSSNSTSSSSSSSSLTASYTGVPQPFDSPLGTNFSTKTCPELFRKIIGDPLVRNCVPLSMLIQSSRSFYEVQTSEIALSRTLGISCNVISTTCNDLFQSYAASVASTAGCKAELGQENQRVQFLFNGLISYLPIYSAACLEVSNKPTSTSRNGTDYCFAAAVMNGVNAADLSLYALPLGLPLSPESSPSCNNCTQRVMGIFSEAARNLTSPLSQNYVKAATMINAGCGPSFVSTTFDPIPGSNYLSGGVSNLVFGKLTTLVLAFTTGGFLLL